MTDLSDRVAELERRVDFLEGELDTSYEEMSFRRSVKSIFHDDAKIEIKNNPYGFFARVGNIDGNDVQHALNRLENYEYGHAVTETGEGLGMEIWTEGYERD